MGWAKCSLLWFMLVAAAAGAVPAQNGSTAAVAPVAAREDAQAPSLREALDRSEQQRAILEAKDALNQSGYARLEVLAALFALLMTILVVVFGIRTERAAARAAKAELADRQNELEKIMNAARDAGASATDASDAARSASDAAEQSRASALSASEAAILAARSAEEHAAGIKRHLESASGDVGKIQQTVALVGTLAARLKVGELPTLSVQEQADLSQAASLASAIPRKEQSANELKVQLFAAVSEKDWSAVLDLARGMRFLHGKDDELAFVSTFYEAFALAELGRLNEASDTYDEIFVRFRKMKRIPGIFPTALGRVLVNRGIALSNSGKPEEAVPLYLEALRKHSRSKTVKPRALCADARYNLACAMAKLGNVPDTVRWLREMVDRGRALNCEQVAADTDFDAVRGHELFRTFLAEQGCR
jgi:tetratricopeptide (TPR) repeat protein